VTWVGLRLPEAISACLFDLDGVLTRTAVLHAAAWKQALDEFLAERCRTRGEPFVPFDATTDYDAYVDGRPRLDGTRSFLHARGIELPEGTPEDKPGSDTVHGIANRKNELVLAMMKERGVEVYPGSLQFVEEARRCSLATAVVSSSANTEAVLEAATLEALFDVRVDGIVACEAHLAGKPAPDTYLEAARRLGVAPPNAAVFEDALAGVEAGRAGGFGLVVGVDRVGQRAQLAAHGADVVVADLAELIGP
jgi:beta-phosphoglucomutase family hydrolase